MGKCIQQIIIDTDMGWDDVMSILLMMKDKDVEIAGITVTGCGETNLEDGVSIARGLLALADNPAPVCAGAATPSSYDHTFPRSFRANMNDVMGLAPTLPPPCTPLDPRSAVRLMMDVLDAAREPVTIISIGGLTNIACLLTWASPAQLARIGKISIMGGAIEVDGKYPGNVADLNNAKPQWNQGPIYATNTSAEWNIFLDPLAAQTAFRWTVPTLPLELVPLNACNNVILTPEYADLIKATDPVASFLKAVIEEKCGTSAEPDPVPVFDPLATTYGVGLLKDVKVETMRLDVKVVDTAVANCCGTTFTTDNPLIPPKQVVMWASEAEFKAVFARLANAPLCNAPKE
ncbi:nucleoside hydrolase [Magnetospirillum aberrantis]|uniref:Nucleoside hydrolase n=1 Tax=Magnetospirillum aberrantis SpK TaxID=908842 RepID=A0A7C9UZH0_9PROT|nr:nucleoside hydrolase [Magnetospirillum aberrantis]NFV80551.1 nucleoside hydrolase [Magnetospirillum aberrantis SpK]